MNKLLAVFLILITVTLIKPAQVMASSTVVKMDESGFHPQEVGIKQGDTVIFENVGQQYHWPASNIHPTHQIYPEFDPQRAIKMGESWQFQFNKAGIWKMHDHLYPQFVGTVTVSGSSENKSSSDNVFVRLINFLKSIFKVPNFGKAQIPYNSNITKDDKDMFNDNNALYSYVKKFGPKQTTAHLNELVPQFGDCHQTAHKAGRFAYEIYGDKAFEQCGAECHSGCYHGATEAYFKDHGTANLTQNLNVLCKSELNPFFSHQCIHGVGHGLMAWSNYQINDALKSCDLLQKRQDSCWTGVFMENIIGALSEKDAKAAGKSDHVSKYLNSDPQYPCNLVEDQYKSSCYFLQTSRMIQLFGADFKKIADACLQAPQIYQEVCFESMGRDVGGVTRGHVEKAIEDCSYSPSGQLKVGCLVGAVQDSFWDPTGQDEAISFCKLLTEKEEKDACYSTIIERAPQVLASKEDIKQFCGKVEPLYQGKCNSL